MRCPTCEGTGEVIGDGDFAPGLKEALQRNVTGAGSGHGQRSCAICVVIEHATPGQSRDALIEAAAGRISARALHMSLRQIGIRVARESISNHRNEAHGQ